MNWREAARLAVNRSLRLRDLYGLRRFPILQKYDLDELTRLNRCFTPPVILTTDLPARRRRAVARVRRLEKFFDLSESRVLDIGTGNGELAWTMASKARQTIGLDINVPALHESIAEAGKWGEFGRGPIFAAGDASSLPFADATFDLLVSYWTLEHIADCRSAMTEFKRVLRPGGKLYLEFGPLFYSPQGHHLYRFLAIPWVHLIFDERVIFEYLYQRGQDWWVAAYRDLNRLTMSGFRDHIRSSELTLEWLDCREMPLGRLPVGMTKPLERYTKEDLRTSMVACVLRK